MVVYNRIDICRYGRYFVKNTFCIPQKIIKIYARNKTIHTIKRFFFQTTLTILTLYVFIGEKNSLVNKTVTNTVTN